MRILYFHQHFTTPDGASGTRSYEMARALVSAGHEVTMICGTYDGGISGLTSPFSRGKRRGVVDGINVIEFDLPYSNKYSFFRRSMVFFHYAFSCISVAIREPCDIVFATSTPLTAAIPGIVARWLRRRPFVFEVRDLWPELPQAMGVITNPVVLAAMSVLERVSYRSANHLVGLSPGIVDGIVAKGVASTSVSMIPNGCDLSFFRRRTRYWRPEGVKDTDFLAVYAGTHGIANGLDAVLDAALELMRRDRLDIKILLIGDGGRKRFLIQKANEYRLNNVIFHSSIPKTQIRDLLLNADLGLQILANVPAFYRGTSPNKFFDYLASGLPVLNNYPGWLADMITLNRCGLVVPPGDATGFADALEFAAANPSALAQMKTNALRLATNDFDRNKLAADFVSALEKAALQENRPMVRDPAR